MTSIAIELVICPGCERDFQPKPESEHVLCAGCDVKARREASGMRASQHCGGDRSRCKCLVEMPEAIRKAIRREATWAAA